MFEKLRFPKIYIKPYSTRISLTLSTTEGTESNIDITGIPADAKIKETKVEILKLPALSPPVPHRSIACSELQSSSGSSASSRKQ